MKTRIERAADGESWNLYVNNSPAVTYESLAVCQAVEFELHSTTAGRFYSEAAEVANVIRASLGRKAD